MIHSSQLESQNFDLSLYLTNLCKKQHFYDDDSEKQKLQIDFISLQKDLIRIQSIQERTCEQIVQFVDQHRQRFIEINSQLDVIEEKVKRSQTIIKLLDNRIDQYRSGCYLNESKIQRYINDYQLKLMQEQILNQAKAEALFLTKFNAQFENITNKEVGTLGLTQKYLISRFTYKFQFFKTLYKHQIVKDFIPQTLQILEIVINLGEQFEFYLSEQLTKYQGLISGKKQEKQMNNIIDALNQIKSWYMNLNKKEEYYKVLEKSTIEKEMQIGEKRLMQNKTGMLSGKDQNILENVLTKIFSAVNLFPQNYPRERLKALIFSFFRKQQVKFLFTYAMPIFPSAYTSYLNALQNSKIPQSLKAQLKQTHGWNLKMWVMVREKNILDRSSNDTDIIKWVQIIFKSNCMLPGTLTDFLKLSFKLINRYLSKIVKSDFVPTVFNRIVEQHIKVGKLISSKVTQYSKDTLSLAKRIQESLNSQFQAVIKQLLNKSLHNVAITCQNSLQPVKTFVSKIIKKDKQFMEFNTVNKVDNIFKPINSFLKNNAELSPQSIEFIMNTVEALVVKYYDTHYVTQIYNYSKQHLVAQQISFVMEVVGRERTTIFKKNDQN